MGLEGIRINTQFPRPGSLSSGLITGVTLYRNKCISLSNKVIATPGYFLAFLTAQVETAIAAIFTLLSSVTLLTKNPYYFKNSVEWLKSSAFSIIWSLVDFGLNPFIGELVADEKSAKLIAKSGALMTLPNNAWI